MATRFAQQFQRTGARYLLRQFGEPVTYYPGLVGASRTITAIVERNNATIISEIGDVVGQALIIRVLNDATEGIRSTAIDCGVDKLSVPLSADDEPSLRSIVKFLGDSNGLVRFLVQ